MKWDQPVARGADSDPFETRHYSWGEILRRVWPLVRRHRWRMALTAGLVGLVGVAVAVMPLFPKYVIDTAIPQHSLRLAFAAMGVFVAVQFTRMLVWYVAMQVSLGFREDLVFHLRLQSFQHVQRLCLRFHLKYPSGLLHDRVFNRSIGAARDFVNTIFRTLVVNIVGLVFGLFFCVRLNLPMTGIVLGGAISYCVISRWLAPRIRSRMVEFLDESNRVSEYILDKLRGTKTIQAFAMEERVADDFEQRTWPVHTKSIHAELEMLRLGFVTEGLGYLLTSAVVVGGAYMIFHWQMPIGTLVAFMGYQASLTGMMNGLIGVYSQFITARVSFDQLFTVLDTPSTVTEKPDATLPATVTGAIEFRNVSFAYTTLPVVRDLSFTVPPGQNVALVGRSGSGKTTIANLLLRFYDPNAGAVLLDGADIRDLPLRPYRALFGVVLQEPYLFNDTIAGNLRCARADVTDAELWAVLEKACAADFVRTLPDGLRHRVGEGGAQLSGGQRQRLAIARCMLLNSRFVILDEPTAALDVASELAVQRACEALFEGRTVFIIAHRLSTIRQADRILVLDGGRCVEEGRFDELLQKGGQFHHLHRIATSSSTTSIKLDEAGFV